MINYEVIAKQTKLVRNAQIVMVCLLSYAMFLAGLQNLLAVFISYTPKFRCNESSSNENIKNISDAPNYKPFGENNDFDGCKRYKDQLTMCNTTDSTCLNNSLYLVDCDKGYVYDESLFTETIVTQFDLVCDRSYLKSLSTSTYEIGHLIGSILFGSFADKLGRKYSTVVTFICALMCSIGITFSNTIITFMVLRSLTAVFYIGVAISTYTWVSEVVQSKHRTKVTVFYMSMHGFGYIVETIVAYKNRNWKNLMVVLNWIGIPFIFIILCLPESPRWLFATNKNKRGKKVINQMVRLSNQTVDDSLYESKTTENVEKKYAQNYSCLTLLKYPSTRKVTFKVMFCWVAANFVYFGVSLNAGELAGDFFLNNYINGIVEIASYLAGAFFLSKLGCRRVLSGCFLLASLGIVVSVFIKELIDKNSKLQLFGTAFAFLGKFGASFTYSFVYLLTSEIFPTVLRSNSIGIGSLAARIGSISAPFVISIQKTISWLPSAIFTAVGFAAIIISLSLPETRGIDSIETIEEAEKFYNKNSTSVNYIEMYNKRENKVFSIEEKVNYNNLEKLDVKVIA